MQVAHLTEAALYVVDVDLNVVLERTENQPNSSVNIRDLMCINSGCLKFVFMSMLYLTCCKLKKINRNVQYPPKVWRQPVIFLLPYITTPCPIKLKKLLCIFKHFNLTEYFIVMNNYFNLFYKGFSILQWWVVHRLLRKCGYFQSHYIQC